MSQQQPVQLQIEIDEATAQGIYTNLAMVLHTETEFVIDFIYIQPHAPKAKVRTRILSTPTHVKLLLAALQENIHRYEEKFGIIKSSGESEKRSPHYPTGAYL